MVMMQTKFLSAWERDKGQKLYFRHASFNGLNFPLMGDAVVYLLALAFDANNVQLGYLSSTLHIAGLVLPFVPFLFKGINIRKIFFVSWIFRGLVCLAYFSLIFVKSDSTGVYIILTAYTLFAVCRTLGMSAGEPIQKMINTPQSLGVFIVKLFSRFNITRLFAQILSFIVLSVRQLAGLTGLLILEGSGIFFNMMAALPLRKIPCRETMATGKGFSTYREIFASLNKSRMQGIFLRWLSLLQIIVLGFVIAFLRRSVGLPANMIFMYSIIASSAVVFAMWLIKPFVERISSKSLLVLSSGASLVCFCLWALMPADISFWVIIPLTIFTHGAANLVFLFSSRVLLRTTPDDNRMEYFALVNFSSAVISLAGGIAAGVLADYSLRIEIAFMNDFSLTFLLGAAVAVLAGIVGFGINEVERLSVKETVQMLFSLRDLKAHFTVHQYSQEEDPDKRWILLRNISSSGTRIVTGEIKHILDNPFSSEKAEILKALFRHPRPELLDYILCEAQDRSSYTREEAVFALGAYPGKKTEQTLIPILDDPDLRIRSSAAKSLGRIGCERPGLAARILSDMEKESAFIPALLNYGIALYHLDNEGKFLTRMFHFPLRDRGAQSFYSLISALLKLTPPLAELFQAENGKAGEGMQVFLENARELEPFLADQKKLLKFLKQDRFHEIGAWCSGQVSGLTARDRWIHIKSSVTGSSEQDIGRNQAIALLYFSFHLMKKVSG